MLGNTGDSFFSVEFEGGEINTQFKAIY